MGLILFWFVFMCMLFNSFIMMGIDYIIIILIRVEIFVCMFGCVYWYCCEVFDLCNLIVFVRFC